MERIRVAMAGIGGFGAVHGEMLRALADEGLVELVAFADPCELPDTCAMLESYGATRYGDYYDMLASEERLDLVTIATPIPHHVPMAKAALERRLHVFLEKPPAVCIQDLRALVRLQESRERYCVAGYQDIARPLVLALKRRLCERAIGDVLAIHAEARWRRAESYYRRASWAGKAVVDGQYVLDGPMNNACVHVLNTALFLAGDELHSFGAPRWVQAELYRANAIEGEDTSCLRAMTDTGVELHIHLTQCAARQHPRCWTVIGSEGSARLHDRDGLSLPGRRMFPEPHENANMVLLRRLVEVIAGSDEPLLMPLASAESCVMLVNGAYESAGGIATIPQEYLETQVMEGERYTVIRDIDTMLLYASALEKTFSEQGMPWAMPSERFELEGYAAFPQRWRP